MNFVKQPIFYAILVAAIIVTFAWTAISNKVKDSKAKKATKTEQTTQNKISNLTNADPSTFDSILRGEFANAQSKALEQNAGNLFSTVEFEIPASLDANSVNSRYLFSSPTDTKNNWMITFSTSSGNFIRAIVPKADYAGEITPINVKLWKYNFVTALQLAEKNGGLSWREKNTLSSIKLTLKNSTDKNILAWVVEYTSSNNSYQTYKLDANSGKMIAD